MGEKVHKVYIALRNASRYIRIGDMVSDYAGNRDTVLRIQGNVLTLLNGSQHSTAPGKQREVNVSDLVDDLGTVTCYRVSRMAA